MSKLKSNKAIFAVEFANEADDTTTVTFSQYLKSLYWKPDQEFNVQHAIGDHIAVSDLDMEWAATRLSSNKAIGVDKLKDSHLKLLLRTSIPVKSKIKNLCTGWINGLPLPAYFTMAKTFLLSKEDTPYQKVGNVRIIAVLPSILKFYE